MIHFTDKHEAQLALNDELDAIATSLVDILTARWAELNVVDRFLIELFNKGHRTFRSLHLLAREGMVEDALCLLRVLVETAINLGYSIRSGPAEAAQRYFDWALLDAVRRRRDQAGWSGRIKKTAKDLRSLLKAEEEMKKRYVPAEIEAFKRKGVFGLSLEDRARIAGFEDLYKWSYRITSRNTHAIDVIELHAIRDAMGEEEFNKFFEVRLDHLFSVARFCLGSHALWLNTQFGCGLDESLVALRRRDEFPLQF